MTQGRSIRLFLVDGSPNGLLTAEIMNMNGTANEYGNLPEADLADMAFFAEQVRTVLPVLGLEFLRDHRRPVAETQPATTPEPDSPVFELKVPKHGIEARAREIDGEFVVLEGSTARARWVAENHGYKALHEQLCEEGVLGPAEGELRTFTADYAFSSPSAAAAVVSGRNANGRTQWVTEDGGQTYGAWQDRQVSSVAN